MIYIFKNKLNKILFFGFFFGNDNILKSFLKE